MDEGSAPPRIEIELTEHEGKRSRRDRRRGPAPAGPAAGGSMPPWGNTSSSPDGVFTPSLDPSLPAARDDAQRGERHRLVVTAIAVGAVALFLGWAIGRSGGDGDGSAKTVEDATTTTENDRSPSRLDPAPDTTDVTGDTLPAAELPATTRPRPSTTTTVPPEWQVTPLTFDDRLAGATDRIVGLDPDGGLVEFDIAAGTMRTLDPRNAGSTSYPPIAGDDWILRMRDDGGAPLVFVGERAEPDVLQSGDPYSIYWQYGTDLFWTMEYDPTSGRPAGASEFDITGRQTGRTIDTGGVWALGSDMAGGLLLNTGSLGLYRADAEGSERLPDGNVLAISPSHLVLYTCGENLDTCGLSVVDRNSGASRQVPIEPDMLDRVSTSIGWWGPAPGTPTVSPDGGAAFMLTVGSSGLPIGVFVDLVTGDTTVMRSVTETSYMNPTMGWSADGRFAYTVIDATLTAYDRATGETFPVVTTVIVDESFDDVLSITVRPPVTD